MKLGGEGEGGGRGGGAGEIWEELEDSKENDKKPYCVES